jgi:aspartate/methionine/tyrosine aminotransferase
MAERTITVGSASKELRMIGWRIGWVVGPEWLMPDLGLVGMANVVVPPGITQKAVAAALEESYEDVPAFVEELQARRDVCMEELKGLPVGVPAGGWAFVIRVGDLGWTGKDASEALMEQEVFATPMDGWGEVHGSQYIRVVFANEPCDRLKGLGTKFRTALKL